MQLHTHPYTFIGQNFDGQNCRILGVSVENFVRRKILSVENFVRRNGIRTAWYSDKTVENLGSVSNILSVEKFCPTKILSVEILSDKVVPGCWFLYIWPYKFFWGLQSSELTNVHDR